MPPFEEYFPNALTASGIWILGVASILGMGHVDIVQACEWALTKPKAILVAEANARIVNDMEGFEVCHKNIFLHMCTDTSRPHVALTFSLKFCIYFNIYFCRRNIVDHMLLHPLIATERSMGFPGKKLWPS